jgi:hypothetical protein
VQVLDQERGNDHPDTVVNPTFGAELTHASVHYGIAGVSIRPSLESGVGVWAGQA